MPINTKNPQLVNEKGKKCEAGEFALANNEFVKYLLLPSLQKWQKHIHICTPPLRNTFTFNINVGLDAFVFIN